MSGTWSRIEGMEQCALDTVLSPRLAASACETVGASVTIRIASNPKMLPIFRWKRLSICQADADNAMTMGRA
jgi:hypothetical protein